MKKAFQGLFITFEGGEGAGKSTLIEELGKKIGAKGFSVIKTREPGGTKLGEEIRQLLLEHSKEGKPLSFFAELSLFLASRAQHILEVIAPALQEKKVVLCDRFNDSSVAYQGIARGLGKKNVEAFCRFISENLVPDLTLFLDIDPKLGLARAKNTGDHDRIEAEGGSFHEKVREGYLAIAKEEPHRFFCLDASKPAEEVFQEAMKSIDPLLSSRCLRRSKATSRSNPT